MTERSSAQLRALRGTERPDRQAPEPPRSPANKAPPSPPSFLDRYGKAKWRELVPELASRRLLTGTALSLLELLCESWSDYRVAREVIRTGGASYASKKGEEAKGDTMMRKRPEVDQAAAAGRQYAALLARFEKLIESVAPTGGGDPMDELLEGGRRARRSAAG